MPTVVRAAPPDRCEWGKGECRTVATHAAMICGRPRRYCCRHYEDLVDRLIEIIERIRAL